TARHDHANVPDIVPGGRRGDGEADAAVGWVDLQYVAPGRRLRRVKGGSRRISDGTLSVVEHDVSTSRVVPPEVPEHQGAGDLVGQERGYPAVRVGSERASVRPLA